MESRGDHPLFMTFRLPELLVDLPSSTYGITILVAAILFISRMKESNLDAIPTVGSNSWLGSLWAGSKFLHSGVHILREGYEKHKYSPFKFADLYRWVIVLSSREHVGELLRASDDDFSFLEAAKDRLHTRYTMPQEVQKRQYHVTVIRSQLTRSIGPMCPVIRDEIITAFDEVLDLKTNDWESVQVLSVVRTIVSRTSNRLFVGLPLCRDPNWIRLNTQFTIDLVKTGDKIELFPKFLRPLAACLFTAVNQSIARSVKFLRPIIEERLRYFHEYGAGAEMPSDALSWLIEETKGVVMVESLAVHLLNINFVAIHTTTSAFTHALFYLAANPQYIQPLREEVETIIEKDGWTKTALARMRKVDSFLKECQRITGVTLDPMRVAMRDYTFTDGTFIPRGTLVCVGSRTIHHDDTIYENPHTFQPFRFAEMGKHKESAKYRLASTGLDNLSFGYGKHACPGRFFAANELKSLLAHTVMTYDIKLDGDTPGPRNLYTRTGIRPDPSMHVLFRKRVD